MQPDVLQWTVGSVQITRLAEFVHWPASGLLPDATIPALERHSSWLPDGVIDETGPLISIQSFVVESQGKRILVDTGIGNDKVRSKPRLSGLRTDYLVRLEAAGFDATTIDVVLCTHLHTDHVGWNTRLTDGEWVPTFPRARYFLGEAELQHARAQATGDVQQLLLDSVDPITSRGLAEFADSTTTLTGEVRLIATPGHTAGHMSVVIESGSERAILTGDVMHHPVQLAERRWGARNDLDPDLAFASRTQVIDMCAEEHALLIGTHFVAPTAWRVEKHRGSWAFQPA